MPSYNFEDFLPIRFIDLCHIVRGIVPQIIFLIATIDEIQAASVVENRVGVGDFCISLSRSS